MLGCAVWRRWLDWTPADLPAVATLPLAPCASQLAAEKRAAAAAASARKAEEGSDAADADSSISESEEQRNMRRAQLASRVLRLWKVGSGALHEEDGGDLVAAAKRKAKAKEDNDKAWNMASVADVRANARVPPPLRPRFFRCVHHSVTWC